MNHVNVLTDLADPVRDECRSQIWGHWFRDDSRQRHHTNATPRSHYECMSDACHTLHLLERWVADQTQNFSIGQPVGICRRQAVGHWLFRLLVEGEQVMRDAIQ